MFLDHDANSQAERTKVRDLSLEVGRLKEENASLARDSTSLRAMVDDLTTRLENADARFFNSRDELSRAMNRLQQLDRDIGREQKRTADVTETLRTEKESKSKLEATIAELWALVGELKSGSSWAGEIEKLRNENTRMRKEIAKSRVELTELRVELSERSERDADREAIREAVSRELEQCRKMLADVLQARVIDAQKPEPEPDPAVSPPAFRGRSLSDPAAPPPNASPSNGHTYHK